MADRIAKIQLPDGRIARFSVGEDASPQDVLTQAENMFGAGVKAPALTGPETMEQSLGQEAQARGPGYSAIAGFGTKISDLIARGKQALQGGDLTQPQQADVIAGRQLRSVSTPAAVGAAAGMTALAAPLAPATLPGSIALGGALGAAEPTLPGESTGGNIARGMGGGTVGNLAPRLAARMFQPLVPTTPAQRLIDQGIVPSLGQAVGGITNTMEQKISSLPFVGDVINSARSRPKIEFNKAELNLGIPPGGDKVSQAGNAGFQEVKDALGSAYDRLYAGKDVAPPAGFINTLAQAKNVPTLPLNQEGSKAFDAILQKALWDRLPNGSTLPAANVKAEIIADIGKAASDFKYSGGSTAADKATGDALAAAKSIVQDWLNNATGTKAAGIDTAYTARKALEKAVWAARAQGGVFSPYQALTAGRNVAPVRALAEDAQSVLGNTVPNSFSADRGLLALALERPTMAGALANLLGVGVAGAAYSRPGSRFLLGDLIPGQAVAANALRSAAPYTGAAGGTLAPQLQNYLQTQNQ